MLVGLCVMAGLAGYGLAAILFGEAQRRRWEPETRAEIRSFGPKLTVVSRNDQPAPSSRPTPKLRCL